MVSTRIHLELKGLVTSCYYLQSTVSARIYILEAREAADELVMRKKEKSKLAPGASPGVEGQFPK